ncbi:protein unc-13 [Tanacetum coccineum]
MALQEEGERQIRLAKGTGELVLPKKAVFSTLLKKWNPVSTGVAAVTLHAYYGNVQKKYTNMFQEFMWEHSWEDENDSLVQLCKLSGKLLRVGCLHASCDYANELPRGPDVGFDSNTCF